MDFENGISWEADLIDTGVECEALQKSGTWINFGELRLGQGRDQSKAYLVEHPEVAKEISDKIVQIKTEPKNNKRRVAATERSEVDEKCPLEGPAPSGPYCHSGESRNPDASVTRERLLVEEAESELRNAFRY